MEERQMYEQKMEEKLRTYDAEIEELRIKAEKAKAKAKIRFYEQIEGLLNKRRELDQKLQALQEAGDEAWEDIRDGAESAWKDMAHALKSAISKFTDQHQEND
jgi:hypothetical protein